MLRSRVASVLGNADKSEKKLPKLKKRRATIVKQPCCDNHRYMNYPPPNSLVLVQVGGFQLHHLVREMIESPHGLLLSVRLFFIREERDKQAHHLTR